MAGHVLFNYLRDGDGEQFFLTSIEEMEQTLLKDFKKYIQGEKTKYNIIELPDKYLEKTEKEEGFKAFLFPRVECSEEAVYGGDCSVEFHYKNEKEYSFYAVA